MRCHDACIIPTVPCPASSIPCAHVTIPAASTALLGSWMDAPRPGRRAHVVCLARFTLVITFSRVFPRHDTTPRIFRSRFPRGVIGSIYGYLRLPCLPACLLASLVFDNERATEYMYRATCALSGFLAYGYARHGFVVESAAAAFLLFYSCFFVSRLCFHDVCI